MYLSDLPVAMLAVRHREIPSPIAMMLEVVTLSEALNDRKRPHKNIEPPKGRQSGGYPRIHGWIFTLGLVLALDV